MLLVMMKKLKWANFTAMIKRIIKYLFNRINFNRKFSVIKDWTLTSIFSPIQYTTLLWYKGKKYSLYIRWRYSGNYTCYIIEELSDYELKYTNKVAQFWDLPIAQFDLNADVVLVQKSAMKSAKHWLLTNR